MLNKKKVIVAFDFDGTITFKDTFPAFIRFSKGRSKFWTGLILYAPLLIAYKIGLYPNWKIKQYLFSFFYKGMKMEEFDKVCNDFCRHSQHLIRPKAIDTICEHLANGASVVIVSAGIENWISPFAKQLGAASVLATKPETDHSKRLTGRFSSPNCYGVEKVRRIQAFYPLRNEYYLIAYGDSSGDKELLEFADERYYRFL